MSVNVKFTRKLSPIRGEGSTWAATTTWGLKVGEIRSECRAMALGLRTAPRSPLRIFGYRAVDVSGNEATFTLNTTPSLLKALHAAKLWVGDHGMAAANIAAAQSKADADAEVQRVAAISEAALRAASEEMMKRVDAQVELWVARFSQHAERLDGLDVRGLRLHAELSSGVFTVDLHAPDKLDGFSTEVATVTVCVMIADMRASDPVIVDDIRWALAWQFRGGPLDLDGYSQVIPALKEVLAMLGDGVGEALQEDQTNSEDP